VAVYFIDSSALVKRYVEEAGSTWVSALLDPGAGNHIYVASLSGVEILSALVRRGRGLPAPGLSLAVLRFRAEWTSLCRVVDVTATMLEDAMRLAERHSLRSADAIQLSALLSVCRKGLLSPASLTLISSDTELNAAATKEGFGVEDPNAHP